MAITVDEPKNDGTLIDWEKHDDLSEILEEFRQGYEYKSDMEGVLIRSIMMVKDMCLIMAFEVKTYMKDMVWLLRTDGQIIVTTDSEVVQYYATAKQILELPLHPCSLPSLLVNDLVEWIRCRSYEDLEEQWETQGQWNSMWMQLETKCQKCGDNLSLGGVAVGLFSQMKGGKDIECRFFGKMCGKGIDGFSGLMFDRRFLAGEIDEEEEGKQKNKVLAKLNKQK